VFGGLKHFKDKDINNENDRAEIAKNARILYINTIASSSILIFCTNYLCGNIPYFFRIIMGVNQINENLKTNLKLISTIMSPLCILATSRQVLYGVARIYAEKNLWLQLYLSAGEILAFGIGVAGLYNDWLGFDSQYEFMPPLFAYLSYMAISNFTHGSFILGQLFFSNVINKITQQLDKLLCCKKTKFSHNRYRLFSSKTESNPIQRGAQETMLNKVNRFARKCPCGGAFFYSAFKKAYKCLYPDPEPNVSIQYTH